KKFPLRITVRRDDQTNEVSPDIQEKRGGHQFGVRDVAIFVLVERLEPRPVSHRVLVVVISQGLGDVFAGKSSREQIRGVVTRVGTKIESRAVKRIDESGGVTHRYPAGAANFLAP